jgi:hypothetical protein
MIETDTLSWNVARKRIVPTKAPSPLRFAGAVHDPPGIAKHARCAQGVLDCGGKRSATPLSCGRGLTIIGLYFAQMFRCALEFGHRPFHLGLMRISV